MTRKESVIIEFSLLITIRTREINRPCFHIFYIIYIYILGINVCSLTVDDEDIVNFFMMLRAHGQPCIVSMWNIIYRLCRRSMPFLAMYRLMNERISLLPILC